jgi:Holliday junction DNA helicase RuvB
MHGLLWGGGASIPRPAPIRATPKLKLPGEPPSIAERAMAVARMQPTERQDKPTIKPVDFSARSGNELRPSSFAEMVGQAKLKPLLERVVGAALESGRPLDHMLLLGSAGTGKTTTAMIIAHELGRDVFMLKAPVGQEVLEELAKVAKDRDVVVIDEIHQQMSGDRRGVTQAADPEQFYSLLEDKRLATRTGMIEFPDVTFIGCTTDAGLLPEPFLARFPLQPRLDPYTVQDMTTLAEANARSLDVPIQEAAAKVFAEAARGTPRILNRYIRNARSLSANYITRSLAVEIVTELNGVTLDGLDRDHQNMLRFLLKSPRTNKAEGTVVYQASIGTIATAIGKSRDQKAVALYVEPYLIERGLVAVTHGGRQLTEAGIERARQLDA